MGKFKLTVVFGLEACCHAEENGTKETVEAVKSGEIYGGYRTYELDTEADAKQLVQALGDANGWDASFYDLDFDENGARIKFDD